MIKLDELKKSPVPQEKSSDIVQPNIAIQTNLPKPATPAKLPHIAWKKYFPYGIWLCIFFAGIIIGRVFPSSAKQSDQNTASVVATPTPNIDPLKKFKESDMRQLYSFYQGASVRGVVESGANAGWYEYAMNNFHLGMSVPSAYSAVQYTSILPNVGDFPDGEPIPGFSVNNIVADPLKEFPASLRVFVLSGLPVKYQTTEYFQKNYKANGTKSDSNITGGKKVWFMGKDFDVSTVVSGNVYDADGCKGLSNKVYNGVAFIENKYVVELMSGERSVCRDGKIVTAKTSQASIDTLLQILTTVKNN